MKGKELKNYESPVTRRTQVMLESGICAASASITNKEKGFGIEKHEINSDFEVDFSSSDWDSTAQ